MKRSRIGSLGEDIAERFLEQHGYRVIARNYVIARGEIDLAAYRRGTVAIVEVKTRSGSSSAVPPRRWTAKSRPAAQYGRRIPARTQARRTHSGLQQVCFAGSGQRPVRRLRFDIIEVYLDGKGGHTVNHIPNAF